MRIGGVGSKTVRRTVLGTALTIMTILGHATATEAQTASRYATKGQKALVHSNKLNKDVYQKAYKVGGQNNNRLGAYKLLQVKAEGKLYEVSKNAIYKELGDRYKVDTAMLKKAYVFVPKNNPNNKTYKLDMKTYSSMACSDWHTDNCDYTYFIKNNKFVTVMDKMSDYNEGYHIKEHAYLYGNIEGKSMVEDGGVVFSKKLDNNHNDLSTRVYGVGSSREETGGISINYYLKTANELLGEFPEFFNKPKTVKPRKNNNQMIAPMYNTPYNPVDFYYNAMQEQNALNMKFQQDQNTRNLINQSQELNRQFNEKLYYDATAPTYGHGN